MKIVIVVTTFMWNTWWWLWYTDLPVVVIANFNQNSFQEHDSFRSFRSQNLNVSIALETKPVANRNPSEFDCPVALLYGSTLR